MQMIVIVYHKILEESIQKLLADHDIPHYTETPRVFGSGEVGKVEDSRYHPGYNACIFAAIPDDHIGPLQRALVDFSVRFKDEFGRAAALRAFVVPCTQIL